MKKNLNEVYEFLKKLNVAYDNNTCDYVSQFARRKLRLVLIFAFACIMICISGANIVMCFVGFIGESDATYIAISTFVSILGVFVMWKSLYYASHASWHLVNG